MTASGAGDARGFTITELLLVSALIALLAMAGVPRAARAFEIGRADEASSVLLSIWRGQRMHWLETHTFADDLRDLNELKLVEDEVLVGGGDYVYSIVSSSASGFTATATRQGSSSWAGALAIDETGVLSGSLVNGEGDVITPIVD